MMFQIFILFELHFYNACFVFLIKIGFFTLKQKESPCPNKLDCSGDSIYINVNDVNANKVNVNIVNMIQIFICNY